MLLAIPPVNQNNAGKSDGTQKPHKNKARNSYIAVVAIFGLAIFIEFATLEFKQIKNQTSQTIIASSQTPTNLNDIETAAFSGSLSFFQDFTDNNEDVQNERQKWLSAMNVDCTDTKITRSIIEDVSFSGSKKTPKSGMWIEHIDQSACDTTSTRHNIAFTVTNDNTIRAIPMINGTSLAHPADQSFAKTHALKASQVLSLNCPNWQIEEANFLGAASNQIEGAWAEEWLIKGCQTTFKNIVEFTPNKDFGTQVSVIETIKVKSF